MQLLKENKGAKSIPLKVSGAFHTELLDSASVEFLNFINDSNVAIKESQNKKVYSNVTANPYTNDLNEIKETLKLQMARPVRWIDIIKNMIDDGVQTFIEVGCKKTLLSFNDKIIASMSVDKENINNYLLSNKDELEQIKEIL